MSTVPLPIGTIGELQPPPRAKVLPASGSGNSRGPPPPRPPRPPRPRPPAGASPSPPPASPRPPGAPARPRPAGAPPPPPRPPPAGAPAPAGRPGPSRPPAPAPPATTAACRCGRERRGLFHRPGIRTAFTKEAKVLLPRAILPAHGDNV